MYVANIHRRYVSQLQSTDWRGSFKIEKHIITKQCVKTRFLLFQAGRATISVARKSFEIGKEEWT